MTTKISELYLKYTEYFEPLIEADEELAQLQKAHLNTGWQTIEAIENSFDNFGQRIPVVHKSASRPDGDKVITDGIIHRFQLETDSEAPLEKTVLILREDDENKTAYRMIVELESESEELEFFDALLEYTISSNGSICATIGGCDVQFYQDRVEFTENGSGEPPQNWTELSKEEMEFSLSLLIDIMNTCDDMNQMSQIDILP